MGERETPSVRERRLAHELRLLRGLAQLTGSDVANRLDWSASKISRIENGRSGITTHDLERLIELYGVADDQAGYLRRLAPSVRPKGWWDAYADTLSAGYSNLIRLEAGSRSLHCYCALVPHALLQTPEYARQVILSTWQLPAAAEVERRVQVCRRRQQILDSGMDGNPLELSVVIDESVLCRQPFAPAGDHDPAIKRDQLDRLAAIAVRPNVTIQVLPFTAGLPPVTAGSFSVLASPAAAAPDVVYLENKTRIFFLDAETDVHRYIHEFELLTTMAMDPETSLSVLRQAATSL